MQIWAAKNKWLKDKKKLPTPSKKKGSSEMGEDSFDVDGQDSDEDWDSDSDVDDYGNDGPLKWQKQSFLQILESRYKGGDFSFLRED